MPIFSTSSLAFLIPAVSISFRGTPSKFIVSSTVSLVVPGMSVTIARSSFKMLLRREDFPTFGFPTIAVRIPSFIIFPVSAVDKTLSILFFISFNLIFISFTVSSGSSYSG